MISIASAGLAAVAMTACYSVVDQAHRADDSAVLTLHDPNTDFTNYRTFAIRDQIRVFSDYTSEPTTVPDPGPIIQEVARNFTNRGFVQVPATASADLGVEVKAFNNVVVDTTSYPGAWYTTPFYPGWGGSYYAPYTYTTTAYGTGTLVIETTALKGVAQTPSTSGEALVVTNTPVRVVWTAFIYRLLSGDNTYDRSRYVESISAAFAQSPYLMTTGGPQ
jgi:hypothetical protein